MSEDWNCCYYEPPGNYVPIEVRAKGSIEVVGRYERDKYGTYFKRVEGGGTEDFDNRELDYEWRYL